MAFEDAVAHCAEEPVRTCSDRPRFSFNFLGFMLGYVDFLLKSGETDAAAQNILRLRLRHRWHWLLRHPRPLRTPYPCAGRLGLWRPPEHDLGRLS